MDEALLLDLTRMFQRQGAIETGIDRVERAYFETLSTVQRHQYLVRLSPKYGVILSAQSVRRIFEHSSARSFWRKSLLAFYGRRVYNLEKMDFSPYSYYVNIGHNCPSQAVLSQIQKAKTQIIIMIHDVIPLDFPEYTRESEIPRFKEKMQYWAEFADIILTPSPYSQRRAVAWGIDAERIRVAPLAVSLPKAEHDQNAKPQKLRTNTDEFGFLIVGTIEPRKNHRLLFKIWTELYESYGAQCPKLWIIGKRGWDIDEEITFLNHSPLMGKVIFELGDVDDETLHAYYKKAQALLFPSHAEGFGLPFYEAILRGKAVWASKIPAFIEAAGADCPALLEADDCKIWKEAIISNPHHIDIEITTDWREHIKAIGYQRWLS